MLIFPFRDETEEEEDETEEEEDETEEEEDEKLAIGHITFLVKTNRVILSP